MNTTRLHTPRAATILASMVAALLAFTLGCESDSTVAITRPVNDYADVLSDADEARLTERIVATRNTTGVQIALLVVNATDGTPIDDYALAAARRWGGGSATRNDGILVTFAMNDRKSDMETGPGVQDRVPDAVAKRILDGARPAMRAHRYADAFDGVLAELDARVRDGATITPTAPAFPLNTVAHNAAPVSDETDGMFLFVFILVGFCGTIGGVMLYRRDARKRALRDEEEADAEFERDRRERLARENARFAERQAQEARARVATKPSPSVPAPTQQAPAYTPPSRSYNRTPEPPRERGRVNYAPSAPASDTGYGTRRTRVSTPPQPYVAPVCEPPASAYRSPTPVSNYRSPSPAFGSSSSSSWGSDSSSSSSSDSSSSSTDWGGGGGSSDGGGASSDW